MLLRGSRGSLMRKSYYRRRFLVMRNRQRYVSRDPHFGLESKMFRSIVGMQKSLMEWEKMWVG